MIRAVLFDRDGTLVADKPRSEGIVPMPGAREALTRLRRAGMRIGVITNQPAVAEGRVTERELEETHDEIEALVGSVDGWFVCPHRASDGCTCRKPQPGLVFQAARTLGVHPGECAVIGDIGSDVEAAHNAGARAVLVPTPVTLPQEIEQAPIVCAGLLEAVECVLGTAARP